MHEHRPPPSTTPAKQIITFEPHERPDVEVYVDGRWYEGELRQWKQLADGSWQAGVQWRKTAIEGTRLDQFPQRLVRPLSDETARQRAERYAAGSSTTELTNG